MKFGLGISLLLAASAFSQTANPRRFMATEVHQVDSVAHLRGHVVMKVRSAVIYAKDAAFDGHEYTIAVHGDSRVSLLPVRAQPDNDRQRLSEGDPSGWSSDLSSRRRGDADAGCADLCRRCGHRRQYRHHHHS